MSISLYYILCSRYILYTILHQFLQAPQTSILSFKGGGSKANYFGGSDLSFGHHRAPQVPLIIGETFGEVLGPQRPTVSELRPAQKLGVK